MFSDKNDKMANQLDFGDFRQIIVYFVLSIWTPIEYRTRISTVTYAFFCFFRLTICIPFQTFCRTVFSKFVKMYTIDQKQARNHEHLDNKTHFVWSFSTMASYIYTKITYLACLVFCVCNNVKMSK